MPDVVVVRAVVDEHPQVHADLVGGQAHARGGTLAGEHVVDERRQLVVELGDLGARLVQHRVADDGDRADGTPLAVRRLALLSVHRVVEEFRRGRNLRLVLLGHGLPYAFLST